MIIKISDLLFAIYPEIFSKAQFHKHKSFRQQSLFKCKNYSENKRKKVNTCLTLQEESLVQTANNEW